VREGPASIRSGCGIGYESGKEFREFLENSEFRRFQSEAPVSILNSEFCILNSVF